MATAVAKREERPVTSWFRRGPLASFREEMRDLLTQTFGEEDLWPFGRISPSLDVSESDQAVEVRMDVPGIDAKEIDIQISSGNMLTISGTRKEEHEEKGKTWHRIERRCGSFSRSLLLPCAVKEDGVNAKYRDGVLTVTLPKTDEAKAHKIKVTS
jgi:HSP20 family protein